MIQTRVYYAHCIALYGTKQEERDIDMLEGLQFEVISPNTPEVEARVQRAKAKGKEYMLIFKRMIRDCEMVVFRALPDGGITSGVAMELDYAAEMRLPVLELPSGISRRRLTRAQTTEYITEVGKR